MTGFEKIELTDIRQIKIDNAVDSILNDITADILEENGVNEQDDPDNAVYWRIYNNISKVNWQTGRFIMCGLNKEINSSEE